MPEENVLAMRFDPNTIEHLGVRMYSQIPTAIAELVANSYDADAKNVVISLYDNGDKKIVVQDNGIGMTFDEINRYFLTIGRNRRDE
ncbi:MAG: ATP-binding protein, partial [Sedimentisphaerales bacterium]|nr:ATP-binding protein [Sedimentisphaerales bacterium]